MSTNAVTAMVAAAAGDYALAVGAIAGSGEVVATATDDIFVQAPNKLRRSADIIELSITGR
jgi:hypothetical protein